MTWDSFRSIVYPLGLLASCFFTARFLVQWIQSEKIKKSHVTKNFWILSLLGNVVMTIHGFFQLQFPLCLIQTINGMVAWRNLDLMKKNPKSFARTVALMAFWLAAISFLFCAQCYLFGSFSWMREPTFFSPKKEPAPLSFAWHLLGFIAMLLFASRFWIQWWSAEKEKKSFLGKSFWWISLIGALFSLIYFIRLHDLVNITSYGLGILPYIRNLFLLEKKQLPSPSSTSSKSLFIFAGEQSGDVLGGKLIDELKRQEPSLDIWGVGGPAMEKAGMRLFSGINHFHVMGFSEVIFALPRIGKEFIKIKKKILAENPAATVLIDYAEFNMKLAASLRKSGYKGKLVHFVCPSVWAWRKNRIDKLAKTLDLALAILPFEPQYFKGKNLAISYVGHPLVAALQNHVYDPTWKLKCGILSHKPLIALFPGSRTGEIKRNLPLQLQALVGKEKDYQIAISCARDDLKPLIQKYAKDVHLVPHNFRYELMRDAHGALATSGTVVLELGLHSTPTVATYRLGTFNYLLGRYAFRILLPYYTLVNIIAEREIFPEFIHKNIDPKEIKIAIENVLQNRERCILACKEMKDRLENRNASLEAATQIRSLL